MLIQNNSFINDFFNYFYYNFDNNINLLRNLFVPQCKIKFIDITCDSIDCLINKFMLHNITKFNHKIINITSQQINNTSYLITVYNHVSINYYNYNLCIDTFVIHKSINDNYYIYNYISLLL